LIGENVGCPEKPMISIGLAVYNDEKFLREALDSLLAQSHENFKLLISDDCSTDGSNEICEEYAARDKRIQYFRQTTNLGISRNMEFLLAKANGEYFMWAGDDDRWHPDFLNQMLEPFLRRPDLTTVFCPYYFIDEEGQRLTPHKTYRPDYSGKHAIIRLLKFCLMYDDGPGYALFRKKQIEGVHFPVWFPPNQKVSLNNIFPPMYFFLSRGNYHIIEKEGLGEKRKKLKPNHYIPQASLGLKRYGMYVVRKFNVFLESVRAVYDGSRSILTTIFMTPFLFLRMLADDLLHVFGIV